MAELDKVYGKGHASVTSAGGSVDASRTYLSNLSSKIANAVFRDGGAKPTEEPQKKLQTNMFEESDSKPKK